MLTLLLFAFVPNSSAQTGGTAAGDDLEVDSLYTAYLRQLDQLGELDIATGPQPQLWDGMVGLMDSQGQIRGTVFVGGGVNPKQESWFMPNAMSPGEEFGFEHQGWYPPGTEVQILAGKDANWDVHPCFNQWAKYTHKPNEELTAHLDYTKGIQRYHFELWQKGELVGRLLREHHTVKNTPEKFVDHWAFFDAYAFPAKIGEQVWALPAASYATTTAFFEDLELEDPDWDAFAQIQYRRQPGFQCLANLSF